MCVVNWKMLDSRLTNAILLIKQCHIFRDNAIAACRSFSLTSHSSVKCHNMLHQRTTSVIHNNNAFEELLYPSDTELHKCHALVRTLFQEFAIKTSRKTFRGIKSPCTLACLSVCIMFVVLEYHALLLLRSVEVSILVLIVVIFVCLNCNITHTHTHF